MPDKINKTELSFTLFLTKKKQQTLLINNAKTIMPPQVPMPKKGIKIVSIQGSRIPIHVMMVPTRKMIEKILFLNKSPSSPLKIIIITLFIILT